MRTQHAQQQRRVETPPVLHRPLLVRGMSDEDEPGNDIKELQARLKDLGYYWAPSEYFDALVATDVTEKVGMIVRARTRYNWRYRLNGNIESTYNIDRRAGTRRWKASMNWSILPSSTAWVLLVSTPVRRSLTRESSST